MFESIKTKLNQVLAASVAATVVVVAVVFVVTIKRLTLT